MKSSSMHLRALATGLMLLTAYCLHAQRYTISGYISEAGTDEVMIGATVLDAAGGRGAVSNTSGFYSLTLPAGAVSLRFSYVGYKAESREFVLTGDTTLSVSLHSATELREVEVTGNRELGVQGTQMSAIEVPISQIKGIPALAGEVDLIKALQLLPGVQSGTEGSAGMYVRGGGPDENLVLLDGVPLYNVNHLLGFFSVFNADAIKNVTLYKGNFPARFGSRLSSVIDIRQNEGSTQQMHGSASIGLLAAKLNLQGPLNHGKTTYNISARRTYFDLLTSPMMWAASGAMGDGERAMAGYNFYDINAKVTHRISDRDKLNLSFYTGDDKIYMRVRFKDSYMGSTEKETMRYNWRWGNTLGAASWGHQFGSKMFANLTLSYTQYRYRLKLRLEEEDDDKEDAYYLKVQQNMHSRVNDLTVQYQFDYAPHPNHDIKYGVNYVYHHFRPQVETFNYEEKSSDYNDKQNFNVSDGTINTHEASFYGEDNWTLSPVVKLNVGLRGSVYATSKKTFPSLEPRVGLRAMLTDKLSAKASYSYMTQYIHLLSNSSLTLPTDLWVPVTDRIDPMKSHQVAAGLFYELPWKLDLSVEGYYKWMNNIVEYKDGATFMGSTAGWEDKVAMGRGWSYGVEVLLQRKVGKLTGWLGYTWATARRQFDRPGQEINYGRPFYAKYDRRHDLSVSLLWQASKSVELSATFIYGTGTRATFGLQNYMAPYGEDDEYHGWNTRTYVAERNNYRMPDYHRLDFGISHHKPSKRWKNAEKIWNFSFYNVYNHKNAFIVYPRSGRLYQLSIFPFMPSISYTIKF